MTRRVLLALLLLTPAAAAQELRVYRARHRPVAELLPIAEAALAGEGRAVVDARTSSLILSGEPAAVKRALDLLAQQDRALRTVSLKYELREEAELRAAGVSIEWQVGSGGARRGRVTAAAEVSGVRARRASTLRLLEGGSGRIVTGETAALPVGPYGERALLSAESGFEVRAAVLGDGRIELTLRPFEGRLQGGELRYLEAETSLIVVPGETAVVGGTSVAGHASAIGGATAARSERVLLLTADVEEGS